LCLRGVAMGVPCGFSVYTVQHCIALYWVFQK
jgi:hypothetical protein